MVRLTDRPDMTLDVYCGRKTTMQQQQKLMLIDIKMKKIDNEIRLQWPFENLRQP